MKKLLVLTAVILSAATSFAAQNPQIRACRVVGGQFLVMISDEDQVGVCHIGLSLVGAIDILNKDSRIEAPLSLSHYKRGIQVCQSQNITTLTTFEGEKVTFCQYNDGSFIDIETVASGKVSGRNLELNKALGL
ncbi:MAG: hypothetical protein ABL930_02790 [Pseudobdellovibrio sp.]